jgi:hypothetical protein
MGIYDTTLLLVGHHVPPKESWWLVPEPAFHEAWLHELPRLTREELAPGVARALALKEREAGTR